MGIVIDRTPIVVRAFDTPWNQDLDALRVCADDLEAAGDTRGRLISLCLAPPSKETRDAIIEAERELLGPLGVLAAPRRPFRALEWRAGSLYAMHLDTRAIPDRGNAIIEDLFKTPEIRTLRHLWIRAKPSQIHKLFETIAHHHWPPPLERLVICANARPPIASYRFAVPFEARLVQVYPNLHLLGGLSAIVDLIMRTEAVPARDAELRAITAMNATSRRLIGHGLVSNALRAAALAALERTAYQMAPFVDLIGYMLQPRVMRDVAPVLDFVERNEQHLRDLAPIVKAITGRPEAYDVAIRRRAGRLFR